MNSKDLFNKACTLIPGGVNSPVRAFGSVGGPPVYMKKGKGSRIWSVEDKEYLDFCSSWGPMILGHAPDNVIAAIKKAAESGTSFGTNTAIEVEYAELLCSTIPYAEKVRLVNSGTEATMTAIRLARGITGKSKIVKFIGNYHGHSDGLLVAPGSGLLTQGESSSAGVSSAIVSEMLVCPYNDIESITKIMEAEGDNIGGVILEPIAGNMGMVEPRDGFLETVRGLCSKHNSILIFDEVITGFRLAPTTFGSLCGVTPDLTCLGKIIGGGLPVGAIAGKSELLENLSPNGNVYQAGTLSGNPLALAAGLETIKELTESPPYEKIEKLAAKLKDGLEELGKKHSLNISVSQKGGMFTLFFRSEIPSNLDEAKECDTDKFAAYFSGMLEEGIYIPPSQFETNFISAAHSEDDVENFLSAADKVFSKL
ncbi:MAG: glutamate-1-semialdehyde 2,1-aminomutase [Planctomycetota bacterium]|jgi:glutamate-1-semialdehyde 2,1-aminomutase